MPIGQSVKLLSPIYFALEEPHRDRSIISPCRKRKSACANWMAAKTTRGTVFLNACMSEVYVGIYRDATIHNKQSELVTVEEKRQMAT